MKVQNSGGRGCRIAIVRKFRNYRKESAERKRRSRSEQPLTACRMGKMVAWIFYASVLPGLSAAAFFLALLNCLVILAFGENSVFVRIYLPYFRISFAFVFFLSGLVLLLLHLFLWRKQKAYFKIPFRAYPEAVRYYRQSISVSRRKIVLSLLLFAAGLIFSLCAPFFFITECFTFDFSGLRSHCCSGRLLYRSSSL